MPRSPSTRASPAVAAVFFWPVAWALHIVPFRGPAKQHVQPLLAIALVLTANLASILAVWLLWKLYRERLGRGATLLGTALLLTSPGAFFLSIGYSESLFVALVAATFLAIERRHIAAAGAFAGAACLVRPTGLLLGLPLLVAWLGWPASRAWRQALIGAGAFLAGAAAYPAYLGIVFGNPLLQGVTEKAGWGHQLTNPVSTVANLVSTAYRCAITLAGTNTGILRGDAYGPLAAVAVLALVIVVTATSLKLLRPWETAWVVVAIVAPLSVGTGNEINRFVLPAFPVFYALGHRLRGRFLAPLAAALLLAGLVGEFILSKAFARGFFVG